MLAHATRFASAARDGRLTSGLRRRFGPLRESYWRARIKGDKPPPEVALLTDALAIARGDRQSGPSAQVRAMEGMSGQRYRTFINALIGSLADRARYLEIGCWKGSTLASALEGNSGHAVAIDNWCQFGGPRAEFDRNIADTQTSVSLKVIEADFRKVHYSSLGEPFNVFLFDGPHEEADQYDGVMLASPALANPHILVVDDWNWCQVRVGTLRAIHDAGWKVSHSEEIRTTWDDSHPNPAMSWGNSDWHNGYFIGLLSR
jgi:hypothetical protein